MNFPDALRSLRIALMVPQDTMAAYLGVPPSTYKSWEIGRCYPSGSNMTKIMKLANELANADMTKYVYFPDRLMKAWSAKPKKPPRAKS